MRPTLADTGKEEELRAQSTCQRSEGFMEQTALLCHPVTKAWADRYRRLYDAADDKSFHSISNLVNGALLASKENRVYKNFPHSGGAWGISAGRIFCCQDVTEISWMSPNNSTAAIGHTGARPSGKAKADHWDTGDKKGR